MNDDNIHTGICIVMPAYHYGANELSHCTVAFLGNTDEVDFPRERLQKVVDRLGRSHIWDKGYIDLWSYGYDWFGVEKDQLVALLKDERLYDVRDAAEEMFLHRGIEWSQIWDYKPHVSLSPDPELNLDHVTKYPHSMKIQLLPPVLWWGDDRPSNG